MRPARSRIWRGFRPAFKRACARLYVSLWSVPLLRRWRAPYWDSTGTANRYSPRGLGLSPDEELARLNRSFPLSGKRVLVIGAGDCRSLPRRWAPYDVQAVATDIASHPQRLADPHVPFALADAMNLGLRSQMFDVVFSEAVLEHIRDIDAALDEMHRVLRPGGIVFAYFGPLWHTFGGSHVSALAYEHLTEPEAVVMDKARRVGNGWEYWLEHGLFNQATVEGYLSAFRRRFVVSDVSFIESRRGRRYRREHPAEWARLCTRFDEKDLLVARLCVVARRADGSASEQCA